MQPSKVLPLDASRFSAPWLAGTRSKAVELICENFFIAFNGSARQFGAKKRPREREDGKARDRQ
ncbi:hypothetical protein [Variovorax paradoxus]|uniref:hypothetical protein n=1 Tax=Variovorax paradoxus TaxID=34073 RepID=UPI00278908E6|nr:hypothetical protein [Variovorax paradoxus]MDQ0586569.1 hypothetical protein [Variovorax paradoxus]